MASKSQERHFLALFLFEMQSIWRPRVGLLYIPLVKSKVSQPLCLIQQFGCKIAVVILIFTGPPLLTTDWRSLLLLFQPFSSARQKRKLKPNIIGPLLLCRPFCLVMISNHNSQIYDECQTHSAKVLATRSL